MNRNAQRDDDPERMLNHVSLNVADVDRSVRFYTDGLGCTFRYQWNEMRGERDVVFRVRVAALYTADGHAYIELFQAPAGESSEPVSEVPRGINHFAVRVQNIDSVYRQMLEAGGRRYSDREAASAWDGSPMSFTFNSMPPVRARLAILFGLDGEKIELVQSEML